MSERETRVQHGDRLCYVYNNCRRPECVSANSRYRKALALRNIQGNSNYVDAEPVRAQLLELLKDTPLRALAGRLNCGASQLRYRVYGFPNRDKPKTLKREFAETVENLRLYPLPGPTRGVLAIGSKRRIEALEALGLIQAEIAAGSGVGRRTIGMIVRENRIDVQQETHDALKAFYEATVPGRAVVRRYVQSASGVRVLAPPFAWDEGSIDDPEAQPDWGISDHSLNTLGRLDAPVLVQLEDLNDRKDQLRLLARNGATEAEVCAWLGLQKLDRNFRRYIARAGLEFSQSAA